ncbi:L,D-transpeptidase family protein [Stakelama flava]|uniref:L,D-transpeptidase family protein n=1 Tax=Stakelama flava TaxID=2860338 RepID=UPI001FE8504C|nr:L,D-transpeptidase family protein [Stakelama flava]
MHRALFALLIAVAASMTGLCPAHARAAETLDAASLSLKNGQSRWADGADGSGRIEIVISLPMQRMFVYRDGDLIGATSVSTGRRSKPTPTGDFTILEKQEFHRSNLYSDAPMPYMQRLTWSGIAMHAGYLPGYPASHGCIRMPRAFARRLYDITRTGAHVTVTDQRIPGALPDRLRQPPPVLIAEASDYESARFNMVIRNGVAFAAPGETVFARARPVVQPLP